MFNTVSWNEFLLTVALILAGYYVLTTLFFHHGRLINAVKRKINYSAIVHKFQENETNDLPELMGAPKPEVLPVSDHVAFAETDKLVFSPTELDEEQPVYKMQDVERDALILGTIPDLLQEITILVHSIPGSKSNKKVSNSMPPHEVEMGEVFQPLLSRYPQLSNTRFREAINMFIVGIFKEYELQEFGIKEIDSWWPEPKTEKP